VLAGYTGSESDQVSPPKDRFICIASRSTATSTRRSSPARARPPRSAHSSSRRIAASSSAAIFTAFDGLPRASLLRLDPVAPAAAPGLLFNISTRATTGGSAGVLTAGFVIGGTVPKTVLIRAVGPGLAAFNIASPIANPHLTLFSTGLNPGVVTSNHNWDGSSDNFPSNPVDIGFSILTTGRQVGAFPLVSSKEAALVATLEPGPYTAQVTGSATAGTALVEVYDVNVLPADRRLFNRAPC